MPQPAREAGDPIPAAVYEAAREFSRGKTLQELKTVSSTAPFNTIADDNPAVRGFLETLLKQGSAPALAKLERRLVNDPLSLAHPVVWCMIQRWYHFHTSIEGAMFSNPTMDEWLYKLISAWTEGITLGQVTASRTEPRNPRQGGGTSTLFLELKETHGWMPSEAGAAAKFKALRFLHDYYGLHKALKNAVPWKTESQAYRENSEGTIRRVSASVEAAFNDYKNNNGYSSKSIAVKEYDQFVRDAFIDIVKGHGGRHWITCALLSSLDHIQALQPRLQLTPALMSETYKTLRKHFGDSFLVPGGKHKSPRTTSLRELKPNP
ncbi:MAG: hypothetical protein GDA67_15085 [Nitrospira sp. CR1.3]|nr:hypothetical protein [Nitrospira sp. CR1.3]